MATLIHGGKIVNTHGVRGEVRIEPWCDDVSFFDDLIYIDAQPRHLINPRPHKHFVITGISGVDCVEQAMALKNKIVCLDKDKIKLPEGRHFVADIIGISVFDHRVNAVIGNITDVLKQPAHDVYVIEGEENHMIPAVSAFIISVDMENKRMVVNTIEGM